MLGKLGVSQIISIFLVHTFAIEKFGSKSQSPQYAALWHCSEGVIRITGLTKQGRTGGPSLSDFLACFSGASL